MEYVNGTCIEILYSISNIFHVFPMYDLTFLEINWQEYYEVSKFNKIEMIVVLPSQPRQRFCQKALMQT